MSASVYSSDDGSIAFGRFVGAAQALTDEGAVSVTTYATNLTTTGAAAITLADGLFYGQQKRIQLIVDGGTATLTPSNLAGGTTIAFADVGDVAELVWDGTEWIASVLYNCATGDAGPALA